MRIVIQLDGTVHNFTWVYILHAVFSQPGLVFRSPFPGEIVVSALSAHR